VHEQLLVLQNEGSQEKVNEKWFVSLDNSLPKVKDYVSGGYFGGKVGDEPRNSVHFCTDDLLLHMH